MIARVYLDAAFVAHDLLQKGQSAPDPPMRELVDVCKRAKEKSELSDLTLQAILVSAETGCARLMAACLAANVPVERVRMAGLQEVYSRVQDGSRRLPELAGAGCGLNYRDTFALILAGLRGPICPAPRGCLVGNVPLSYHRRLFGALYLSGIGKTPRKSSCLRPRCVALA